MKAINPFFPVVLISILSTLLVGQTPTLPPGGGTSITITTWSGRQSSEWSDPKNWSDGVPGNTSWAIFKGYGNTPVIASNESVALCGVIITEGKLINEGILELGKDMCFSPEYDGSKIETGGTLINRGSGRITNYRSLVNLGQLTNIGRSVFRNVGKAVLINKEGASILTEGGTFHNTETAELVNNNKGKLLINKNGRLFNSGNASLTNDGTINIYSDGVLNNREGGILTNNYYINLYSGGELTNKGNTCKILNKNKLVVEPGGRLINVSEIPFAYELKGESFPYILPPSTSPINSIKGKEYYSWKFDASGKKIGYYAAEFNSCAYSPCATLLLDGAFPSSYKRLWIIPESVNGNVLYALGHNPRKPDGTYDVAIPEPSLVNTKLEIVYNTQDDFMKIWEKNNFSTAHQYYSADQISLMHLKGTWWCGDPPSTGNKDVLVINENGTVFTFWDMKTYNFSRISNDESPPIQLYAEEVSTTGFYPVSTTTSNSLSSPTNSEPEPAPTSTSTTAGSTSYESDPKWQFYGEQSLGHTFKTPKGSYPYFIFVYRPDKDVIWVRKYNQSGKEWEKIFGRK